MSQSRSTLYKGHKYQGLIPLMREFWQVRNGLFAAAATELLTRGGFEAVAQSMPGTRLVENISHVEAIGEGGPLALSLFVGLATTLCAFKRSTGFYLPYDRSPVAQIDSKHQKQQKPRRVFQPLIRILAR